MHLSKILDNKSYNSDICHYFMIDNNEIERRREEENTLRDAEHSLGFIGLGLVGLFGVVITSLPIPSHFRENKENYKLFLEDSVSHWTYAVDTNKDGIADMCVRDYIVGRPPMRFHTERKPSDKEQNEFGIAYANFLNTEVRIK